MCSSQFEDSGIMGCVGVVSMGESSWLPEKDPGDGTVGPRLDC